MTFTYAVNCSLLFTELPVEQRAAAAQQAGFSAVEFWWPFSVAVPPRGEVDAFVESIRTSEVTLAGLNFFAGDMPGGERGALSSPTRSAEFRDNLNVIVDIAERTGCTSFNALVGNREDGLDPAEQDDLMVENLALAAQAVAKVGGTVLIEAVSGTPTYPLKRAADVIALLDRVKAEKGVDNLAFLFDAYHLDVNGDDVFAALESTYDRIDHVQIADNPGRCEPGTGELDIPRLLDELERRGYDKYVALEYKPTTTSIEAFDWLPRNERGRR